MDNKAKLTAGKFVYAWLHQMARTSLPLNKPLYIIKSLFFCTVVLTWMWLPSFLLFTFDTELPFIGIKFFCDFLSSVWHVCAFLFLRQLLHNVRNILVIQFDFIIRYTLVVVALKVHDYLFPCTCLFCK